MITLACLKNQSFFSSDLPNFDFVLLFLQSIGTQTELGVGNEDEGRRKMDESISIGNISKLRLSAPCLGEIVDDNSTIELHEYASIQ